MCRPRKNVLIYCQHEVRLSLLRFVLHNLLLYRIHGASSMGEVTQLLDESPAHFYEVALVVHSHPTDDALAISSALTCYRNIPTLFLVDGGTKDAWQKAVATVALPGNIPTVEWLERIRIMSQRKRGPKKNAAAILGPAIQTDHVEVRAS